MKVIELTKQWQCVSERGRTTIDFPYLSPCFGKVDLTACPNLAADRAFLDVDGVNGIADIFVGGECYGTITGGARRLIDCGSLGIDSVIGLSLEDGGGVTRGVSLHYSGSRTYIRPYGLFVKTDALDGQGADITVEAEIDGDEYEKRKLSVEFSIINARGKRSCRKKKNFVYTGGEKKVILPVKMRRAYPYLSDQPYMYTLRAALVDEGGNILDEAETPFGITLNRFDVKLNGATLHHSNGLLGELGYIDAERRKLSALRDLGYNCVRYVGCPSENALCAADELGLKVIVDLFANWTYPVEGSLSHATFRYDAEDIAATAVKALRNHPCVIIYSISDGSEETYGRRGAEYARKIVDAVRACDNIRPIACAFKKLVPTRAELLACGVKKGDIKGNDAALVKLGDAVGLHARCTSAMLDSVDIAIYCDGLEARADKPYIRVEISAENAFAAFEEAEDNENMLGSLSANGMDYSKRGIAVSGDVDFTCLPAFGGLYRSMLDGHYGSFITVAPVGSALTEGRPCWNAADGEKVNVKVFTRGDVVALYLNGYLVGRRLAGKVNEYHASFDIEYHGGVLEAVTYLRGREYDRVSLKTPSAASSVKLLTGSRKVRVGDLCFIDVWVLDRDGETVADYCGDLTVRCEGGGEVVAIGNEYGSCAEDEVCTVVNGHALIVLRAIGADKIALRALGQGLNYGRLNITVTE